MNGYFDALIGAATGRLETALPLPSPPFAEEEEAGFTEIEMLRQGQPPQSPAAAIASDISAELPPSAASPPAVAPATKAPPPSPQPILSLPSDGDEALHVPQQGRETTEHLVTVTEQRTIHVTEQVIAPLPARPSTEATPSASSQPIDHFLRGMDSEPETEIREEAHTQTPDHSPAFPSQTPLPPVITLAVPLAEPPALEYRDEQPAPPPALTIDIAQIDIRIVPPEKPAPPVRRTPEPSKAVSLADYLAQRSEASS